jgi:CubicO group peptidase (beta-lactamase class C family)
MQKITSQEKLHDFTDFVHSTMQEWNVQGLAIAIVHDGEVLFEQGFGKRDVAHDLAVTPHTLFPIASCTKAFTTAALGILADEGKLDWDTPVRHYLPAFKLYDTLASERITPRDLVTHRSGLPRHDLAWYHSSASRQELFERLQYLEPSTDIRSFWQYQNIMYMTAGYLLEQITGQTWEDFVQERLFKRLEMAHSNFSAQLAEKEGAEVSRPYQEVKDEVKELPFYEQWGIGPAGSIVSCVEDMSKWVRMHLKQGLHKNTRILSAGQVARLHTPQMIMPETSKHPEMPYSSYAHGWFVLPYKGYPMVRHGGNIDGFSSLTTLFPRENIGMVVLTNMGQSPVPSILTYNAFERLLGLAETPWRARLLQEQTETKAAEKRGLEQSATSRIPDTQPSHALAAYTGNYAHPGYGVLAVSLQGEQLQATFNNMAGTLKHYHYDIFELLIEQLEIPMKVSFTTNVQGDIESLTAPFETTAKDIVFRRTANPELREKSFLEQFVGIYEMLSMQMIVALKGENALQVSVFGQPDYELEAYKGTEFHVKGMSNFSVVFQQNATKAVQEALLTLPYGTFTAKKVQ